MPTVFFYARLLYMTKPKNFSIVKAPAPLLMRAVSIVVATDALYIFTILFLVGLRNILGLDATLIGLAFVLFFIKSALSAYALYGILNPWLKTSYYVMDKKLVIHTSQSSKESKVLNLKEVRSVSVSKSRLGSVMKYGSIRVLFAEGSFERQVIIKDVANPELVAGRLDV